MNTFSAFLGLGGEVLRVAHEAGQVQRIVSDTWRFSAEYVHAQDLPFPDDLLRSFAVETSIAGRWAISGFPVLSITHRLAATLMATNVSAEAAAFARAPYPGVVVRLPTDLLFVQAGPGQLEPAVLLAFTAYSHQGREVWSYSLMTETIPAIGTPIAVWMNQADPAQLASEAEADFRYSTIETTDVDDRAQMLAGRLILGLSLWLSDPANLGQGRRVESGRSAGRRRRQREAGELPSYEHFMVGREVQLDTEVVQAVRDYSIMGGRSPKVQSIVAGHWKSQPYGPGRSLRRMQHIAPYWRGPLDAPVLTKRGRE